MAKKLILLFLILINNDLYAEEIFGHARVIDGDTVHIGNFKIRLEGIDAPEIKQICKKPYLKVSNFIGFTFNKNYNCGLVSKKKLIDKIDNSKIKCISTSKDRYKRYLATCYKNRINLNKWMVRYGHAVEYKRYSNRYSNDEKYAKENNLGIWQGKFIRPEKWRKLN